MPTIRSETDIVTGLRARDEAVFGELLDDWSRSMLRVARAYVSTDASAEEVVQDTWLAVIQGIDGFQGRSSVRTWIYRILVNTAKNRGVREHRTIPAASFRVDDDSPTADPRWFHDGDEPYPRHWRTPPDAWPSTESAVLSAEARVTLRKALDSLPERQRTVITLRDVLGHTADEVCELLQITAANQRVILHRARSAVRSQLAGYFAVAGTRLA